MKVQVCKTLLRDKHFRHRALVFTHDSKTLFTGRDDDRLHLWNVESQNQQRFVSHKNSINSVAVSPDNTLCATASSDRTIHLFDVDMKAKEYTALCGHTGFINQVVFCDNNTLLSCSNDGTARLWNITEKECIYIFVFHYRVNSVAVNKKVVAIANGPRIDLFHLDSKQLITSWTDHTASVYTLAFHKDLLISGGCDHTVRFWDTNQCVQKLDILSSGAIYQLAVAPNGSMLACACDRSLKVFNLQTLQLIHELQADRKFVQAVAFSPDGKWLAVESDELVLLSVS